MLTKIILADVPYFWQLGFQDIASISMEGILTFNKHLTFLLLILILISLFFFSVFMIFYCRKVFEFIGCMLEIRVEDIEFYLESEKIEAAKITKALATKEIADTRDAEIDESVVDFKKIYAKKLLFFLFGVVLFLLFFSLVSDTTSIGCVDFKNFTSTLTRLIKSGTKINRTKLRGEDIIPQNAEGFAVYVAIYFVIWLSIEYLLYRLEQQGAANDDDAESGAGDDL